MFCSRFVSADIRLLAVNLPLQNLLEGFPNAPNLETLGASFRLAVDRRRKSSRDDEGWVWNSWDENWTRVVRPLVLPNVRIAG